MASEASRARTLAVLLHADVVGSTRLVQENEETAHARITDAFTRLSGFIRDYGGTVHEVRGDALVAEMRRASDAVAAAIAFQANNAEHNQQHDDGISPEIRVGVSLGEVIFADKTVTGPGIVLAQRVEQLASPGGVCVTGAVHEAIPSRMPFAYRDLGQNSAKGFDEPVQVYAAELKEGEYVPKPDALATPGVTRTRSRLASFAAVALLVVAGGVVWLQPWQAMRSTESPGVKEQTLADVPSIAVLPFSNISSVAEQEYFADGMTEDIITDLSKLSGLFVIARSSSFAFKGKQIDVKSIAKDLNVRYVLEGSVRREGQRIRINAQLIDATSGSHLWGERYDRALSDVFAVQDEIARKIVVSLRITLSEREHNWLSHAPTDNVEAYDVYLRARTDHIKVTKESTVSARRMYQRAVELDPAFAGAYAALGATHWLDWIFQWGDGAQSLARAYEFSQKALQLDDSLALSHLGLGQVYIWQKRHEDAIRSTDTAIALEPNYAMAHGWRSFVLSWSGRPDEAIESVKQAMRLHPKDRFFYKFALGFAHSLAGRYEEAVRALEGSVANNPHFLPNYTELAFVYGKLGRNDKAEAVAAEILRVNPKFSLDAWARNLPFKEQSVLDAHIEALRAAGLK